MRKLQSLILIGLALVFGASCQKQEAPAGPKHSITVEKSNLAIPAKGGVAKVVVKAEDKMEIALDKEWCSYTVEADTIWVSATQNEDLESRYAVLSLTSRKEVVDLSIHQFGFRTSGFAPKDIVASPAAASFVFEYDFDEKIEAVTTADWVTLTIFDSKLVVELDENTTQGTPENPARTATVEWVLGMDHGVINITQNNLSFMNQDSNWRVYFDGIKPYESYGDAAYIYNEVTDPTLSGSYAIYYTSKDEYIQSGLSMEDYVLSVADVCREELLEMAEYYSVDFSEFLYEDTDFEIFDPMEPGDYIAFALGYDADANITGHYQYADFTVKGSGPSTGSYEDWLGEWTVPHGSGSKTDTWVFTEKVKGQSYYLTGIEGYTDLKIEVEYDSASKSITAYAQEEIGTKTVGGEEASVGFYAATAQGNFWTPGANPYVVFSGKMNGNTATISPEPVNTQEGEVTPELALYIATTSDGYKLLKAFADATKIPNTMTKKGGDDPNPPSGAGYEDWLGTWLVPHGSGSKTDTWVFTEKVKGQTYSVTGIEGYTDLSIEVEYDSASKSITAYAQQEIGTKTVGGEEASVGFYAATAQGNFWTPGANPYAVFTGVMNGKTATLSPVALNTEDGEVTPELALYIATTSSGYKLLKAFADATKIPATMTREEGGGDNPGGDTGDGSIDDVVGKWICPSVTDYWGENTFSNWTFDISKSGSGLIIKGFDVELEATAAANDLTVENTPATYDASSKTIIVSAGTETGLAGGDYPIVWIGLDEDFMESDIEFKVNFTNHTLSLSTELFGAYIDEPDDPGFFSLYQAPVQFYKEGHVPGAYKPAARTSSAKNEFKTLASKKSFPMLSSIYGKVGVTARRVLAPADGIRLNAIQAKSAPRTSFKFKGIRK